MRMIKFRAKRVNGGEWVKSMTISYGTIKRKMYNVFFEVEAPINLQLRYYFIKVCFATRTRHVALLRCGTSAIDVK